jgi:hypothetical protein
MNDRMVIDDKNLHASPAKEQMRPRLLAAGKGRVAVPERPSPASAGGRLTLKQVSGYRRCQKSTKLVMAAAKPKSARAPGRSRPNIVLICRCMWETASKVDRISLAISALRPYLASLAMVARSALTAKRKGLISSCRSRAISLRSSSCKVNICSFKRRFSSSSSASSEAIRLKLL